MNKIYVMVSHNPQFSKLGIQVSLATYMYVFIYVCLGYSRVGYFTFLFSYINLVCYTHVFPCIILSYLHPSFPVAYIQHFILLNCHSHCF